MAYYATMITSRFLFYVHQHCCNFSRSECIVIIMKNVNRNKLLIYSPRNSCVDKFCEKQRWQTAVN